MIICVCQVDTEVSTELKKQIKEIMVEDSVHNQIEFYDEWSGRYDKDLVIGEADYQTELTRPSLLTNNNFNSIIPVNLI